MEEKNQSQFEALPNRFEGNCFGCSPDNPVGLQMKFAWNGQTIRSTLTVPKHLCGWNKLIHGGVASTILDEVMSWAAIHTTSKMVMTKTMTIDFIKPIQIGDQITAEGRVKKISGRHELITEGFIYNKQQEICVQSTGYFATFTQKIAKRLGIIHPDTPDPFEKSQILSGKVN